MFWILYLFSLRAFDQARSKNCSSAAETSERVTHTIKPKIHELYFGIEFLKLENKQNIWHLFVVNDGCLHQL